MTKWKKILQNNIFKLDVFYWWNHIYLRAGNEVPANLDNDYCIYSNIM